jgi:hypothetical protein
MKSVHARSFSHGALRRHRNPLPQGAAPDPSSARPFSVIYESPLRPRESLIRRKFHYACREAPPHWRCFGGFIRGPCAFVFGVTGIEKGRLRALFGARADVAAA